MATLTLPAEKAAAAAAAAPMPFTCVLHGQSPLLSHGGPRCHQPRTVLRWSFCGSHLWCHIPADRPPAPGRHFPAGVTRCRLVLPGPGGGTATTGAAANPHGVWWSVRRSSHTAGGWPASGERQRMAPDDTTGVRPGSTVPVISGRRGRVGGIEGWDGGGVTWPCVTTSAYLSAILSAGGLMSDDGSFPRAVP